VLPCCNAEQYEKSNFVIPRSGRFRGKHGFGGGQPPSVPFVGPFTTEAAMARKFIDCREYPSENKCSVAIYADTDEELLEAAVQHGCAVHGYQDTPELRKELRGLFKTDQSATQGQRQSA
jgi:hypothetical protein